MSRRPRLSIGLQLVLLLMACLVVMHLVFFTVVGLFAPPRPFIYRVSEVASALTGGALTARDGRPLLRTTTAALPAAFDPPARSSHAAFALAGALGRNPADVRLVEHRPGGVGRFLRGPVGARILIEHRRETAGPPPPGDGAGLRPPADGPGPHIRTLMMRDAPIFGDFTAALRGADGRWVVVRPSPEGFPTDWQIRIFLIVMAAFAVVAPAGLLFARRITAPIKRFSEAAERLGRDPHAAPVMLSGPAEIGVAAEAFNNMQARVKRYIDDRTGMVGAISHDLRTPLARIRFKMEGAPETLKASVLNDVVQMEQMLQGVLAFIRDEGAPRTRERLDLLSVVECVADDAALVGQDVEIVSAVPAEVEGDPIALQRMFANLVDNAVKYGGQARIRIRCEDGHAVVDIADAGPGLSDLQREQVFQPFHRIDAARNVDAGGIGLGLPIARSTARAHGGDVALVPGDVGLIARVTLPTG